MNKTININLGGVFFHIDEIAYHKLKQYLDAISRSLNDDPQGRDEILNDIELRISELLSDRIKNERQVVNENDIDEITKIMGKPEDYLVDEELFENENPKQNYSSNSKKLFRDNDDKFLGGVCAGIGHFIGIDALWVRILWLILVSFFGTGIIIYIILWILVPPAISTSEKLQMKGEPVNISNIEKKIREEFNDVSSRFKDGATEVSSKLRDGAHEVSDKFKNPEFKNRAKTGIQEVIDTLGKIFITLFTIFGKFIGAILIFITSMVFIGLIFLAFSWGSFEIIGFNSSYIQDFPFYFNSVFPTWLLVMFTFFAIAIPFIALFMLGLKILSNNVKSFSTTTKLSLIGIWLISILGLGFAGIKFASQKAHEGVFNKTEELPITVSDTLHIKFIGDDNLSNRKELIRSYHYENVYDNNIEKLYSTRINLDIKQTDKASPYLKIRKVSEGNNRLAANHDAEEIEYQFNLTDNNLKLNGYFLSNIKNQFKDQLIDVTLYLPINYVVYLDHSTKSYLQDIDNIEDIYDGDMPQNFFKMTKDGLSCINCNPLIFGNEFKEKSGKFNMKIDENGLKINVEDGTEDAQIKIDKSGVTVN